MPQNTDASAGVLSHRAGVEGEPERCWDRRCHCDPPPPIVVELPVTTLPVQRDRAAGIEDGPAEIRRMDPPVRVTFRSDRFPLGPSTSKMRTAPDPLIVAPKPFTEIRFVTTGRPFSLPLFTVVRL